MRRPAGIRCENVVRHYPAPAGVVHAVDGISLEVTPGSSLAITGPSGCGKSTLLGLIGALDAPTSGRVWVGDVEVSGLPARDRDLLRRKDFGFVFQADNLLPYLTGVENVAMQLALAPAASSGDAAIDEQRPLRLLAELGVGECAQRLPEEMSGGQRVRVAIARALAHSPAVILADEPTGSVDEEAASVIVDLLRTAQQAAGATLVVVTHDLDVAARLDRTIRLGDGRIAEPAGQRRET